MCDVDIIQLFEKYTNRKYLSKNELIYRINPKHESSSIWGKMVQMRREKKTILPLKDQLGNHFWFMMPPFLNKKLNQIDSVAKREIEEIASKEIYTELLVDSMIDEAFYSSVIEGAFSTKKRAKEVIKSKNPKDKSEQMILNNFEAMMYVLEHVHSTINDQTIITLHKILTKNTLSKEDMSERYRNDTVYVKVDNEVVYEAPHNSYLEPMMESLYQFITLEDDAFFIHPIIKASIVHFYIGYVHPFFDGNGRVARALAYMYLIQHGYDFFKFFSISSIIAKHRNKYYKSYLLSEEEEKDITYFINTQVDVTSESITEVIQRLGNIYNEELLKKQLEEDHVILSNRQEKFLKFISKKSSNIMTVENYKKRYDVAYETARKDLNELSDLGLMDKIKKGRKFIYIYRGMKGYLENN